MSVASSSSSKSAVHDQTATRTQAQQEQQQKNQQQAKAFEKASTPTSNIGTGYGGGRITFDKSGNTLQDGKIVQFAGRQAQESYLAERGYGNTGIILDQSKAEKADFSNLQRANISGVVNAEQPTSGFGWNWGGNISGGRQMTRSSSLEQQIQQREAEKASQVYGSFSNPDYATGGKRASEKQVVTLDKAQAFFGKTKSGEYGWKDIGKDQLVRGSKQEEQVKNTQAEKAFLPSISNKDYVTGGTPEKTSGGVITAKSFGKSAGWGVLAPDQLSRNTPREERVKQSEATRASVFVKDTSKQGYESSLIGLTDKNARENTASLAFLSRGKPLTEQQVQERNNQIALGNALISLSNKQIAAKNISSDKEFRDYLHKGTDQGAVFSFFVGNKKVGETSGARSYHDYLKARQKFGNNVSVGENFPSREKTLSEAVQKNTPFYASLPQSYWDALSKEGYFSEKNQGKINEQINLYGKIQNRENLAMTQGFLFAENRGGEIFTEGGRVKVIGPAENEVASFVRTPFSGGKTYNKVLTDLGQKPTTGKISTSTVPSTSFFNVIQFIPGLPIVDKFTGPLSEWWITNIARTQGKLGGIKTTPKNEPIETPPKGQNVPNVGLQFGKNEIIVEPKSSPNLRTAKIIPKASEKPTGFTSTKIGLGEGKTSLISPSSTKPQPFTYYVEPKPQNKVITPTDIINKKNTPLEFPGAFPKFETSQFELTKGLFRERPTIPRPSIITPLKSESPFSVKSEGEKSTTMTISPESTKFEAIRGYASTAIPSSSVKGETIFSSTSLSLGTATPEDIYLTRINRRSPNEIVAQGKIGGFKRSKFFANPEEFGITPQSEIVAQGKITGFKSAKWFKEKPAKIIKDFNLEQPKKQESLKDKINREGGYTASSKSGVTTKLLPPKQKLKPQETKTLVISKETTKTSSFTSKPINLGKGKSFSILTRKSISLGVKPILKSKSSVLPAPKQGTQPKLAIAPKQKPRNRLSNIFQPFQSPKQGSGSIFTPKQGTQPKLAIAPKQKPNLLYTPKQGTQPIQKPKQTPKLTPYQSMAPLLQPKQTPTPINIPITPQKPPKPPPPILLFGSIGKKHGGKSKSGPTGLINLEVKNIFASSFDIKVPKNKRVEF